MSLYTQWIGKLGHRSPPGQAAQLTRRWILQMALNVALMTGIFIAADYLARKNPVWLKNLNWNEQSINTAFWVAAVICSLPLFIATSRKLGALGLLIAETRVSKAAAGERTAAIRSVVAQVIPIAGTAVLGFYVLVLTSALLPGPEILLVLLLMLGLVAWLLRRSFIKVYSHAQAALQETFSQPELKAPEQTAAILPSLLREALLETSLIANGSPAARKLIHELKLRTQTGASIVAIERNGQNLINPGPDEELIPGDRILLLGSVSQLEAARKLLT
jgi:CPA2 family monovalent cation:H+ antiporter-2